MDERKTVTPFLTEYQTWAWSKVRKDLKPNELTANMAMGLAGEAGEFIDLLKKHIFHGKPISREKLSDELGDVLYYVAMLANLAALNLQDVMEGNMKKLDVRFPEGFKQIPEGRLDYPDKESK